MPDDPNRGRAGGWGRIAIEVIAIVVSILLAFAIDAWWAGRLDRQEEREILRGLREEFSGYVEELQQRTSENQSIRTRLSRLLEAADSNGAALKIAAVDSSLFALVTMSTWDPGRGTLAAVVSSGRLELIRSENLRNRLASWGGVVEEVRDGELMLRSYVLQTIVPFLASEGVLPDRAYSTSSFGHWPESVPFVNRPRTGYRQLVEDLEFVSLTQFKLVWEAVSAWEYEQALLVAGEIVASINHELGGE